jgi:hypothetical protein
MQAQPQAQTQTQTQEQKQMERSDMGSAGSPQVPYRAIASVGIQPQAQSQWQIQMQAQWTLPGALQAVRSAAISINQLIN